MPSKLVVVVVLLALNLLISATSVALQGVGFNVVGLVINALLIYGVLKGNESVRQLLIVGSWIGLVLNGLALLIIVPAFLTFFGTLVGITTVLATFVGVARCGYTIWALKQPEVQTWMFKRTLDIHDEQLG